MNASSISYGNSTMVVSAGASPTPQAIPKKDIITYRAVEMKDGWVGQVIVDGNIVKEEAGFARSSEAEDWATAHISKKLQKLLS